MCTFSSDVCMPNTCYLYIIEHIEVADKFISSKNRFTAIFHNYSNARHPGQLKKQIWVEKTSSGNQGRKSGDARGATSPQKFCLAPPVALPKFFRSLSESPTQTIDSSPCCKAGPSSGPPKWKCLAPPLVGTLHGHTRKNACYRNLKWTFEDFMPYYNENQGQRKRCKWHIAMPYCYATKTYSKTIR